MIVHGIPRDSDFSRGDILSVDVGVVFDGWVADAARTFPVGQITPVARKLLTVTEESLFLAVPQCQVGNRLGAISHAIQQHVEAAGLSIVRAVVGHGIAAAAAVAAAEIAREADAVVMVNASPAGAKPHDLLACRNWPTLSWSTKPRRANGTGRFRIW